MASNNPVVCLLHCSQQLSQLLDVGKLPAVALPLLVAQRTQRSSGQASHGRPTIQEKQL